MQIHASQIKTSDATLNFVGRLPYGSTSLYTLGIRSGNTNTSMWNLRVCVQEILVDCYVLCVGMHLISSRLGEDGSSKKSRFVCSVRFNCWWPCECWDHNDSSQSINSPKRISILGCTYKFTTTLYSISYDPHHAKLQTALSVLWSHYHDNFIFWRSYWRSIMQKWANSHNTTMHCDWRPLFWSTTTYFFRWCY